jgi:DNA invertase Pin-like site-specific DNA recombinase
MLMDERVRRLRPNQPIEAAGYIRVSTKVQTEGYSPEVQRDAIKRLAAEQGYALTMTEEDHERGSKVTRAGYQKIIEAVRAGTIHAVIVFMFDRWGRDGAEWLARAREFERIGVPIISVQEGKDEGGLIRFMRAGMAEEYSRQLAKRIRPSRERAAREGKHMGTIPFGFQRVHEAYTGATRRRSESRLTADEAQAAIVRELFHRYAGGGWSLRGLAVWLNTSQPPIPSPNGHKWTASVIHRLLTNPVYIGMIRYNYKARGLYERCTPEDTFIVEGQHEALVSKEVWDRVQERLQAANTIRSYNRRATTPGRPVFLGTGLLHCTACGGFMASQYGVHNRQLHTLYAQYLCLSRTKGKTRCAAPGYKAALADAALAAEARRLRGAPWTTQAEARLLGADGRSEDLILRQQRQLEAEREALRKHTRRMTLMEDDPTPEQIAAFREVSAEISGRIRTLEAQLAERTDRAEQLPALRELHTRLTQTEIPDLIDALLAQEDKDGLRELLLSLIATARIVERWPARQPVWARADISWTPDVQTLLDAGLLRLDPPLPMLGTQEQEAVLAERTRAAVDRLWGRRRAARTVQEN